MIQLTPKQVAQFDQAFAESVDCLMHIVGLYISCRKADAEDGIPDSVSVMNMALALAEEWDTPSLVGALAAAIVLIADHTEPQ